MKKTELKEVVPTTELTTVKQTNQIDATALEAVLATGDLSKLTSAQRVEYYNAICNSLGLNVLTRPFDYIVLSGKTVLYAKKDCTEQLRKINAVSITKTERTVTADGVCIVEVQAQDGSGRTDSDIGAVTVGGLRGDQLANAYMKANTKAKRRVTLSICGLGFLDESEIQDGMRPVAVNHDTGEILTVNKPVEETHAKLFTPPAAATIPDPEPPVQQVPAITHQQRSQIGALFTRMGIDDLAKQHELCRGKMGCDIHGLTKDRADQLIMLMQNAIAAKGGTTNGK